MKLIFILSYLLFILNCKSSLPQKPTEIKQGDLSYPKQYIQSLLEFEQKKLGSVGIGLSVVDNETVLYENGIGFTDIQEKKPVSEKSIFFVGSISKLFTAIAVMQLVESGKIQLDQPITKYLPELKIRSRFKDSTPPTVRNLLTHHSGLPGDRLKGWYQDVVTEESQREYEKLPLLLETEYLAQPTGKVASYSNIGYSLLGAIVAKVSGKTFVQYVQENITQKLNMSESGFDYKDYGTEMSKGYSWTKKIEPEPIIRDLPAGSFRSSIRNMSSFLKMLNSEGLNGKILKPTTFQDMLKIQNNNVPLDIDFKIGLCFWLPSNTETGLDLAGHGGDVPPFHALLLYSPKYKVSAFAVSNTDGISSFDLSKLVVGSIQAAIESKEGKKFVEKEPPKVITITEEEVKEKEGIYTTGNGMVEVKSSGNKLSMNLMNANFHLIPLSDGTFHIKFRLFGLIPLSIEKIDSMKVRFAKIEGKKYFTIISNGIGLGVAGFLGKEWEQSEILEPWLERTGKYTIMNPDKKQLLKKLEILKKNNVLFAKLQISLGSIDQTMKIPIKTISKTEAIMDGVGRNMGDTIQVIQENNTEVLLYSGYHFKKE